MDAPALVDDAGEVAAVARACSEAGVMALDLEFVAQDRYRPDLALVQVAWSSRAGIEVRLIDAVAVDPSPVIELTGGEVDVIIHAARQDLQILASRFDVRVRRLFDTQIAAAFSGLGDQIGYARLVEALLGERLGKEQQWTDWLRRPLANAQLRYAAADVHYLVALAELLSTRLADRGRRSWVDAECEALAQIAFDATRIPPDELWRDVAGARSLDAAGRAAVRRLAAWRIQTAQAINQPPSWLAGDKALIELARTRPNDERSVARIRGLGDQARRRSAEILMVLAAGAADVAAGDVPEVVAASWAPPGPRAQLWEEVIVAVVQGASEEAGIPSRWLATRGDAEDFAQALDRAAANGSAQSSYDRLEQLDHPLLTGWRRTLVGERVLAWLRGDLVVIGDPEQASGIRMVPRTR